MVVLGKHLPIFAHKKLTLLEDGDSLAALPSLSGRAYHALEGATIRGYGEFAAVPLHFGKGFVPPPSVGVGMSQPIQRIPAARNIIKPDISSIIHSRLSWRIELIGWLGIGIQDVTQDTVEGLDAPRGALASTGCVSRRGGKWGGGRVGGCTAYYMLHESHAATWCGRQ